MSDVVEEFQTHPCGVEVSSGPYRRTNRKAFQTHPCGVEVRLCEFVGQGLYPVFQTHPCGVEVRICVVACVIVGVSDAPLWG